MNWLPEPFMLCNRLWHSLYTGEADIIGTVRKRTWTKMTAHSLLQMAENFPQEMRDGFNKSKEY